MKNRKLILILSLVLALTMSLGGTLAYLTDTDADVNTMVLGNVKIEQLEYERVPDGNGGYEKLDDENGYKLQQFTQDKPLLPATGAVSGTPDNDWDDVVVPFDQIGGAGNMQVLDGVNNIQDKFVVVKNTGNTNAYVRTFIAYEAGSYDLAKWDELVMTCNHVFWDEPICHDVVSINGNNYVVVEYVYSKVLGAGEVSRNSLSQIYLMPKATNEDLQALDGNANGTYDILVLSQAIQADGWTDAKTALDTGFGEANTTNIKAWFEGDEEIKADMPAVTVVNVSTANELMALSAKALTGNNGTAEEYTINITADIDMTGKNFSAIVAQRGDKLIVKGNGYTISNVNIVSGADDNTTGQASMFYCYPGSTLEVSNLTLKNVTVNADANDTGFASAVIGFCEGNAILNNVDVVNAKVTGVKSSGMMIGHIGNGGTLTATGCNLNGTVTLAQYDGEAAGHYAGKYIGTLAGPVTLTKCTASVTVSGALKEGNGADGDVYGRKVDPGSLTVK